MSCHGFFYLGHKEFGNLLIRHCTIAISKITSQKMQHIFIVKTPRLGTEGHILRYFLLGVGLHNCGDG
jgi:hypothetical protein